MKTKTLKEFVFFLLLCFFSTSLGKAQCTNPTPTACNVLFSNSLYCNQSVDITWDYSCNGTSCGGGGVVNVPAGTSITLTCPSACTSGCGSLTDLCITVVGVNNCTITPVTGCWSNYDPTTCGLALPINCPCPPPGVCCDTGTSLLIYTNINKAGVN